MKLVNKLDLKIDNFDKCHITCDQDCPLGQLYDYACAFKAFVNQKIQEAEAQSQSEAKVADSEKV